MVIPIHEVSNFRDKLLKLRPENCPTIFSVHKDDFNDVIEELDEIIQRGNLEMMERHADNLRKHGLAPKREESLD